MDVLHSVAAGGGMGGCGVNWAFVADVEKRKGSFIRLGKRKGSFIRLGKRKGSFIRLGRSANPSQSVL